LDGELFEMATPMVITIVPQSLLVRVPRTRRAVSSWQLAEAPANCNRQLPPSLRIRGVEVCEPISKGWFEESNTRTVRR